MHALGVPSAAAVGMTEEKWNRRLAAAEGQIALIRELGGTTSPPRKTRGRRRPPAPEESADRWDTPEARPHGLYNP